MLLKRLRPRLVAVAALLTVTSFTIADAAVGCRAMNIMTSLGMPDTCRVL